MASIKEDKSYKSGLTPQPKFGEITYNFNDRVCFYRDSANIVRGFNLTSDLEKVTTGPIKDALDKKANIAGQTFTGGLKAPVISVGQPNAETPLYPTQLISQIGNNNIAISTNESTFLAFNLICTAPNLQLQGSGACISANSQVADVQWSVYLYQVLANGSLSNTAIVSNYMIATTNSPGAGTAPGSPILNATNLVIGTTYQAQLRAFTNNGAANLRTNSLSLHGRLS